MPVQIAEMAQMAFTKKQIEFEQRKADAFWQDDDYEEYDEDGSDPHSIYYYERRDKLARLANWPFIQTAKPSVAFLVKHSAPVPQKPKHISERIQKNYEANEVTLKMAADAVANADIALKVKQDELAKAVAEGATVNKWSNRAGREALLTRLKKEVAELDGAKKAAVKTFDKIVKDGELTRSLVYSHKRCEESFVKYKKAEHAYWEVIYGEHRPLKTESEIFGHYDVIERVKRDNGTTFLRFAAGTDVDRVCREMELGGYENFHSADDWVVLPTE